MERCEHKYKGSEYECIPCAKNRAINKSALSAGVMCKCGCQGKASYIVESEDYEGRPFKEPCCIDSRAYLRDGAYEFNKPYKETLCT